MISQDKQTDSASNNKEQAPEAPNIKTPDELFKIITAEALGDAAFEHILGFIQPGMTEIECADEIERFFMENGAEGLSFPTIFVSGKNTELMHGEPSEKKIEMGDFITMDIGCMVDGYCGDMTRTVAMGSVTPKMQEVYDIVLEAQLAGLEALEVGASCFDIDKIVRDIIAEAGYGEYYIHGTGHGVGRQVHENPYINTRTDEILHENMAVTVEPGIYIPGEFGVRIEDLAIVTNFAIINTTHSPKELIIL